MARRDLLDEFTNIELIGKYRLDRDSITFLSNRLDHLLSPKTQRNKSLATKEKVLITLRYLATSVIQLNDGEIHDVSQPTVSRAIEQVTDALCSREVTAQFIKFPTSPEEIRQIKTDFFNIANFPNVVGVVDGTHIQIQAPCQEEPMYVNRMGYHSINTQITFDAQSKIIDIVPRWPGSTHDSRILRESGLFHLMENGVQPQEHSYLLGDSGYPCKRWLLTPFLHPVGRSQQQYNIAHKRTRALVERGIGQLKRRWGILHGEIRTKPFKACKIIMSCAVLHNLCKQRQLPLIDEVQGDGQNIVNINAHFAGQQDGLRYRDYVANTFF